MCERLFSYAVSPLDLNIRVAVAGAAIVQQPAPGIMTHQDVIHAWGKGFVLVRGEQVGQVLALCCALGFVGQKQGFWSFG